jgi:hypothetical protein
MADLPPARVLECTPDSYHDLPGFSPSLAKIVIRQSVRHAKDVADQRAERIAEHEESSDDETPEAKQGRLDKGSIYHSLVLKEGKSLVIVPSAILSKNGTYGTDAAKAVRDAARAAGKVPIKEHEIEAYQHVADVMRSRIAEAGHQLDGRSELAIGWWERTPHGPVECRTMLDHVVTWSGEELDTERPTMACIFELKPVPDATPAKCERTAENLGYGIAAAANVRALNALYPSLAGRIEFRFLWCEYKRPFEIWDPARDGVFTDLGEKRWLRAVYAWSEGLAAGRWPGHRTPGNVVISAPMYAAKAEGYRPEDY